MTTETALPTGESAEAGEQAQTAAAVVETTTEQAEGAEQQAEGKEGEQKEPPKKEKTPEQREIERLRRRVDNLTRQKYEAQARQPQGQREEPNPGDDADSVTLTRAELQKQIEEQAKRLAPSIQEQRAEAERRSGIVKSLEKSWGKEEFDAKASDLDDAFGGLADAQGRPKPATDAIFEADDPKALIEYLTDPDNADEAERIANLSAVRAGREIARIELKLKEEAAKAKPKPSKAPQPLEPVTKGGGPGPHKDPSQMTDREFAAWRRSQIAQRK